MDIDIVAASPPGRRRRRSSGGASSSSTGGAGRRGSSIDDGESSCRVCRMGEDGGQLLRPCCCRGSIQYCHEECLVSWLAVSRGSRCELCKHPFRWEKVYASEAPSRLPAWLLLRHLLLGILSVLGVMLRAILVSLIWLCVLPYSVFIANRFFLQTGYMWGLTVTSLVQESSWREIPLFEAMYRFRHTGSFNWTLAIGNLSGSVPNHHNPSNLSSVTHVLNDTAHATIAAAADAASNYTKTARRISLEVAFHQLRDGWFAPFLNFDKAVNASSPAPSMPLFWLLGSHREAAEAVLWQNWHQHKDLYSSFGQDCFSGQIIVCCVVVLFVTSFVLREWVVANQPHPDAPAVAVAAIAAAAAAAHAEEQRLEINEVPAVEALGDRGATAEGEGDEEGAVAATIVQIGANPDANDSPSETHAPLLAEPPNPNQAAQAFLHRQAEIQSVREWSEAVYLPQSPVAEEITWEEFGVPGTSTAQDAISGTAAGATGSAITESADSRNDSAPDAVVRGEEDSPIFHTRSPAGSVASPVNALESPHEAQLPLLQDAAAVLPPVLPDTAPILLDANDHEDDWATDDSSQDEEPVNGFGAPAIIDAADAAPMDAAANGGFEDDDFFEADLEGILEAIGFRGPLLALLQNAALMTLIIVTLLFAALWVPLTVGKTFVGADLIRLTLLPINVVRLVTDPLADALLAGTRMLRTASPRPSQPAITSESTFALASYLRTASSIVSKLREHIAKRPALASLLDIRPQSKATLRSEAMRSLRAVRPALLQRQELSGRASSLAHAVQSQWLHLSDRDAGLDRALCIVIGYVVVLAGGALYLRYTRNMQARNATKLVRDAVRQQFVLGKAAMFFIVEIVVFPSMCGLLLNLATIPLVPGVTIRSRAAFYLRSPLSGVFLTWLAGTNFMYAFAALVGVIRKSIRPGVLWFIRDPTDPDTNPLREILETSAINQAKKITRSLLVYGGIVLTCFGIFPWSSYLWGIGPFPLRWHMTQPISSVPLDLLFILFILPHTLGRTRPKRFLRRLLTEWCALTSRQLRLSSYMLGKRRSEEEGSHIRKSWKAWLLSRKAPIDVCEGDSRAVRLPSDVEFRKDGSFGRVVAADNVKIVAKCMFVSVNEDGSALDGDGAALIRKQLADGPNDESKFTVVYLPPYFTTRATLFVYLLWLTGSTVLFTAICAPLVIGRFVLDLLLGYPAHDLYSMLLGLHALLWAGAAYKFGRRKFRTIRQHYPVPAPLLTSRMQRLAHASQVATVSINAFVILPTLLGLVLQLYVLHPFSGRAVPTLSLRMAWAYGLVVCSLAKSVSRLVRPHALAVLLPQLNVTGITRHPVLLNSLIKGVHLRLVAALVLPGLFAWIHIALRHALWHALGSEKGDGGQTPADVYRTSLFSASCTIMSVWTASPIRILGRKWMNRIWEKEYVIQRKLRNIDDPPSPNEEIGTVLPVSPRREARA